VAGHGEAKSRAFDPGGCAQLRRAPSDVPGIGRETHKMMLDHYQQTKNLLVSYSPKALGFF
jgi:hypothetical protein